MTESAAGRKLSGVLYGSQEPVLQALPQRVLHDLGRHGSESAALWNQVYARATPHIALAELLALPRLWGSELDPIEDWLVPYYWGFNLQGERLRWLDEALAEVDGPGPSTEVDLFLLGGTELVLIEAKTNAEPGRCGRYAAGRCPEIHRPGEPDPAGQPPTRSSSEELVGWAEEPDAWAGEGATCRYWELEQARFSRWLEFGARPSPGSPARPCDRHYQLGRTLLLGQALAERLGRRLHLWILLPQRRWPRLQPAWQDFAERVKPPDLWRRVRAISWEALGALPAG